jgi:hypothetical protein
MKKKQPAPHEVVKSYVKVAQERLKEVFFTRPEWRKAKSAHQADWIIGRIDEVYYPFSDKDKHKVAVWKQVLKEKREELLEQLKAESAKNAKQEENSGAKAHLGDPQVARGAAPSAGTGENGHGRGSRADREIHATSAWSPARVADLKADIKKARAASKIARKLGVSSSYIGQILKGHYADGLQSWIPKIIQAYIDVVKDIPRAFLDSVSTVVCESAEPPDASAAVRSDAKSPFDMPQRASYPGGSLTTDLKDGVLTIQVRIDVAAAIQYEAMQLAKDELKITFS